MIIMAPPTNYDPNDYQPTGFLPSVQSNSPRMRLTLSSAVAIEELKRLPKCTDQQSSKKFLCRSLSPIMSSAPPPPLTLTDSHLPFLPSEKRICDPRHQDVADTMTFWRNGRAKDKSSMINGDCGDYGRECWGQR